MILDRDGSDRLFGEGDGGGPMRLSCTRRVPFLYKAFFSICYIDIGENSTLLLALVESWPPGSAWRW